mmetsp:Transcript_93350/g.165999  ORF Transcript_93350/g.165999 Transcript_93350/m.165999 type:complete len:504 (+) Transcript_93350:68-1579(+)|eukprot:CAMPEP_0197673344 /NCGR_PEP_ID=MMETSP1338-20131121/80751_1 /TAXON_ID=43686 ORGANISM="Pelagodinium beii, Strain RCC1491" /NCGR_SAMPLE_ID=MMETSP1338 /ASSEMBLY_ACC=CAM_ASM_000754 /LENGTH=503 /DNA_ID=CAMNT_0043253579 /DNA_START=51 /DNA_END=1562 /DNA_ORIENTATION=-
MADEFEEDEGPSLLERALFIGKKCLGVIAKGSPPEPIEEVAAYMKSLGITQRHLLQIYSTFHWLKQEEDEEEIITTAYVVDSEVLPLLIDDRRKWVIRLLRCILKLGDCEEEAPWDKFLWVVLRFCSLNKVELAQTLFLCILRIRDSTTYHYIRCQELQDFFALYRGCPVKSFDTSDINFDLLPLRRYYASDFAELLTRFNILLNPMLHLQQSLQARLPGTDFWDNSTGSVSFCRKITFDFFLMETGRIFLRGEPPFRETCDMLSPDALGAVPINQDQWILRTWVAKGAQGLAHLYVWGEQASPEVMEVRQLAREEEEERQRIAAEKQKQEEDENENKLGEMEAKSKERSASKSAASKDAPKDEDEEARKIRKKNEAMKKAHEKLEEDMLPAESHLDMPALTRQAAILDEEFAAPFDTRPPSWMKSCSIAPAPQMRGPDPPIPRPLKEPPRNHLGSQIDDRTRMLKEQKLRDAGQGDTQESMKKVTFGGGSSSKTGASKSKTK